MEALVSRASPSADFWHGKRVLVTGHTGFKGGWLTLWLSSLGAKVTGLALKPATQPSLFELARLEERCAHRVGDIRDAGAVEEAVSASRPEIILHLAAQPLVLASYKTPVETFATNVQGTVNLLEAARHADGLRAFLAVTTDKVYRNVEWCYPYREIDPLGGKDPYSASKAAGEIVVASYRDSFLEGLGVAVGSARAGNVIGGGDWSEDRLIPDAVRAWLSGDDLHIRNPAATRPWQHVLEPLAGYLLLVERMWRGEVSSSAWNFGPEPGEAASVHDIVENLRPHFDRSPVVWGDPSHGPKEARWLALETAKTRQQLGISPRWGLPEALARTAHWYRAQSDGADARSLCIQDIQAFEAAA